MGIAVRQLFDPLLLSLLIRVALLSNLGPQDARIFRLGHGDGLAASLV